MNEPVHIKAQTAKFTTLADGTKRVYLDLVEPADPEAIIAILGTLAPGILVEWAGVAYEVKQGKEWRGQPN